MEHLQIQRLFASFATKHPNCQLGLPLYNNQLSFRARRRARCNAQTSKRPARQIGLPLDIIEIPHLRSK